MARTSRPRQVLPLALRDASIIAVCDVTPNMRRLTIAGPELAGGTRDGFPRIPFRSEGFDDHIKIVIPGPDGTPIYPGTQGDGRVEWAPGALPATRDYTVRRWSVQQGTFDIDVVRHAGGRASQWAYGVRVGDPITFAGPRISAGICAEADWHLLIADETGLPAVGRWLEEAPAGHRAQVIVEVPTDADRQTLPTAAEAEITWLVREAEVAAGHSGRLFAAVREFHPWPGRGFIWGGAETMTLAPIRTHLRAELGLRPQDADLSGYWRRAEAADAAVGQRA